jgi:hypothetical protein
MVMIFMIVMCNFMVVMLEPFVMMRLHPAAIVADPPITIVPCMMIVVVADDYRTSVSLRINGRRRVCVAGAGSVSVTVSRTGIDTRRARENNSGEQTRS